MASLFFILAYKLKTLLKLSSWLYLACGASYLFGQEVDQNPPNVIIILADDLGYGDIGVYGAQGFKTPNLDRMAQEGIRFSDFYVPGAVCTPSRAGLLVGCYPQRVGLANGVLYPHSTIGLNPEETTIAELLETVGYATACFGKWHLGSREPFMPWNHGFKEFFGIPYSNNMNHKRVFPEINVSSPALPLYHNKKIVERNPKNSEYTRRLTEHAVDFIEQHKDESFFVYLPHVMPHFPFNASQEFKGRAPYGLYGDVIEELDWSVGQILELLKRTGIDKQTLVIFTSDNGPRLQFLNHAAGSPGPLRGEKGTTWEGGLRVPAIMRWPGKIPQGTICSEIATAMDLLPTLANLAHAPLPTEKSIDGRDIWPLMSDQPNAKSPHDAFYYYRFGCLNAVRSGPWKLHVRVPEINKESKWKGPQLFNLDSDLAEGKNVAEQQPEVVRELMRLLDEARSDIGDVASNKMGANARPVGMIPIPAMGTSID